VAQSWRTWAWLSAVLAATGICAVALPMTWTTGLLELDRDIAQPQEEH
jgi:hypothetical protein